MTASATKPADDRFGLRHQARRMSHDPIGVADDLPDQPPFMDVAEVQRKNIISVKSRNHTDAGYGSKEMKVEHARQRVLQGYEFDVFLFEKGGQSPERWKKI